MPVTVVETAEPTAAEFVVEDRLYRPRTARPVKLAAAVNATLIATLAPLARSFLSAWPLRSLRSWEFRWPTDVLITPSAGRGSSVNAKAVRACR